MNKHDYDYQVALIEELEQLRKENKELKSRLETFENEGGSLDKEPKEEK